MTPAAPLRPAPHHPSSTAPSSTAAAASRCAHAVLGELGSGVDGLDEAEVTRRRERVGPNAVRSHRVSALAVLGRQLRSALLGLLLVAAAVSFIVGERSDATVIGLILAVSVGLGFANEYRAERAGAALHDRIRHEVTVVRAGRRRSVDVVDLVPGDVVQIELGMVVPADLRLLAVQRLECDEGGHSQANRILRSPRNVRQTAEILIASRRYSPSRPGAPDVYPQPTRRARRAPRPGEDDLLGGPGSDVQGCWS
jgi:magnesium-transporting ATPase (P-type)